MMAPAKSKPHDDDEDISQLRKPITLHGKPVEQVLNAIHYGSPELRFLLLNECDMIFECKVCRALFRDLPNFISHKRRYCSKSASEINHFVIGQLPEERVVVVQPQPVNESETTKTSSSTLPPSLEESIHRIHTGESGKSHAFQVYSNAAAKLKHQKDHARITSLRAREIPTNSNAVFIDVNSTSANIHDRPSVRREGDHDDKSSSLSIKTVSYKAGEKEKSTEKRLRSRTSNSSKTNENSDSQLTDRLMKELKVIQNKVKSKSNPQKQDKTLQDQHTKVSTSTKGSSHTKQKINVVAGEENSKENTCSSVRNHKDTTGLLEMTRHNLLKTEKDLSESDTGLSSKDSSDCGMIVSKERSGKSKKSLICPKCGSIFSSRKSLQFHIKTNHAVKRMFYPCPCCSNIYYYFNAVTRHLQRNHGKSNQEINDMRQELRSKAFSRPSPSQESNSKLSNKRSITGSRRSLRYKDMFLNKKTSNVPYVYSLIKRGKKLSAKKDPVLSEIETKPENLPAKEKPITPKNVKQETLAVNRREKREQLRSHLEKQRAENLEQSNGLSPVLNTDKVMSSIRTSSVGIQIQTCNKCSRLFGRKATYENHIKVCEDNSNIDSESECKMFPNKANTDNRIIESPSVPTRRKGKVSLDGSISTQPKLTSNDFLDNYDINDSGSECSGLSVTETDSKGNHENRIFLPSDLIPRDPMAKIAHRKSTSPVKVERLPNPGRAYNHAEDHLSLFSMSRDELSEEKLNTTTDDTASISSCESSSFTVTRLKSKGVSPVAQVDNPTRGSDQDRFSVKGKGKDCKDITDKVSTKVEVEASVIASNAVDRPRRKRKVPSRNIEAVEFLQKIHRSDKDEPSGKKMKDCVAGDNSKNSPRKMVSLKQQSINDVQTKTSNGQDQIQDESCSVSRTRVNANKIFVLNNTGGRSKRDKLECYNHSKVEKYMDVKKLACLKCGAKFSFIHNLKRHVVRLHLKWSRFKCKLCSFNCFDKSECNTHIVRRHRNGRKPNGNYFFNALIIDLAKKGSKAMTLKKHQTIKANKSQQQEEEKNIYKNQNALKGPRLHERQLDSNQVFKKPRSQLPVEEKREVIGKVVKVKTSPSRVSVVHTDKVKTMETRSSIQVTHLVPRKPRTSTPQTISSSEVSTSTEKGKLSDISSSNLKTVNSSLMSNDKSATTAAANTTTVNSVSSSSSSSFVKKSVLPFNISTRNSPRVFDTSPYNRKETVIVAQQTVETPSGNDVVLHTRHGSYTKTLPVLDVKEAARFSSSNLRGDKTIKSRDTESVSGNLEMEEKLEVGILLENKDVKTMKTDMNLEFNGENFLIKIVDDTPTVSDDFELSHGMGDDTKHCISEITSSTIGENVPVEGGGNDDSGSDIKDTPSKSLPSLDIKSPGESSCPSSS